LPLYVQSKVWISHLYGIRRESANLLINNRSGH